MSLLNPLPTTHALSPDTNSRSRSWEALPQRKGERLLITQRHFWRAKRYKSYYHLPSHTPVWLMAQVPYWPVCPFAPHLPGLPQIALLCTYFWVCSSFLVKILIAPLLFLESELSGHSKSRLQIKKRLGPGKFVPEMFYNVLSKVLKSNQKNQQTKKPLKL